MLFFKKDSLFFFHNSDTLIQRFEPRKTSRPSFYWFSDRYHNHLSMPNSEDKYIHFFVKNPRVDNLELRSRHSDLDFNSLYDHFLWYKEERASMDADTSGEFRYCEPAILMSFSTLEPTFIAKFDENNPLISKIVFPEQYKGEMMTIFDDSYRPVLFIKNEVFKKMVSNFTNVYPFKTPQLINGKYYYKDWNPMKTEKNGIWI